MFKFGTVPVKTLLKAMGYITTTQISTNILFGGVTYYCAIKSYSVAIFLA